jgi:hypothetical protein
MYKKPVPIHDSHSRFYRKMYICLLVWWHLCPIWPPVIPLNRIHFDISFCNCHELTCPLQTSYIPRIKSNIHFRLFIQKTIQVQDPLWHFVTSLFFIVRSFKPHARPSNWRTTPCWLSATAYSLYSQLPSIFWGHLLHLQPENAPWRVDKGPT